MYSPGVVVYLVTTVANSAGSTPAQDTPVKQDRDVLPSRGMFGLALNRTLYVGSIQPSKTELSRRPNTTFRQMFASYSFESYQ